MRTWQIDRRTGILALVSGAVLLLTNLAPVKQNAELKARTSGLRDAGFLPPGDSIPLLRGIGTAGEDVVIRSGPTAPERAPPLLQHWTAVPFRCGLYACEPHLLLRQHQPDDQGRVCRGDLEITGQK